MPPRLVGSRPPAGPPAEQRPEKAHCPVRSAPRPQILWPEARRGAAFSDRSDHRRTSRRGGLVGVAAEAQDVRDDAERPDIYVDTIGLAPEHLGSHERRGAHDADELEAVGVDRPAREAKVAQLDDAPVEEEVVGLHIPVSYAYAVDRCEPAEHVSKSRLKRLLVQLRQGLQVLQQRQIALLQHDVRQTPLDEEVHKADNVRRARGEAQARDLPSRRLTVPVRIAWPFALSRRAAAQVRHLNCKSFTVIRAAGEVDAPVRSLAQLPGKGEVLVEATPRNDGLR
mmetsp:Transcript_123541/g.357223  ORF Transcript_123541/g.357223 Transcript_123541/m.357223 type:complete len:283 (+) Transcript_123541:660-1508(+)